MATPRCGARSAIVLLAASVATACGSAPVRDAAAPAGEGVPARAAAGAAGAIPPDSLAALEALFRERAAQARTRFTDADVRFVSDMIVHHAQALVMADMAPERAASPALRTLAARIRNGQVDEIARMQHWLRERRLPVPDPGARAGHDAHAAHGAAQHAAMPGMLTEGQLASLEAARGAAFDRLFLMLMIEHHRGAMTMVDTLLAADGAAQDPSLFRLASDIRADQAAEIDRMQQLLATLLGGGGSR